MSVRGTMLFGNGHQVFAERKSWDEQGKAPLVQRSSLGVAATDVNQDGLLDLQFRNVFRWLDGSARRVFETAEL